MVLERKHLLDWKLNEGKHQFCLILGVKTYHLHEWRRTKKTKKSKQKIERT